MGESSPDLSLRLRRGSSDSRDSYYMDFAQGIDSDIEEVTRPGDNNSDPMMDNLEENGNDLPPPIEDITTIPEEASEELREEEEAAAMEAALRTPEGPIINTEAEKPALQHPTSQLSTLAPQDWPGLPAALPSPASPSAVIVSPETLSRHSSSSPSHTHHRQPQFALALPCSSQPISAVCYPVPTFLDAADDRKWKKLGCDALATTFSALYGKLLVVMGIAFPMAEVISTYIPPSFYEGFYLYLYFGSMIFLVYTYATLLRDTKPKSSGKGNLHFGGHVYYHHGGQVRIPRGLKGPHHMFECRRTNIMGSLVQDASPFLFPCTIEYSLICAAILYVMWKNISKAGFTQPMVPPGSRHHAHAYSCQQFLEANAVYLLRRSPHHYSVDCARAHKGLFVGILILVLTIISLILFFVLISRPELVGFAVTEVNICELTLYGMSTMATLIGMFQMRKLRYDGSRNLELDNILLVAAQTGMFIYSTFTIIGAQFTLAKHTVLVLVTALASVLQTTFQTIFILDASRRSVATAKQIRKKPGREIVTFLLVTNLAMWAINTLEKSRAESHPVQLHFYGLWAWTIITHVSMPLAIFYRFHSTVCLCEVWKRAYKVKPTYM
ncbi:proton channel OtopLc isoform X4 [Megalopta genalis]|uniref:proton channel OtopLc isoform X4 n=1 Tax=Megalopta genalis TaxID=115081 RepID=UPI00144354C5|nr:proton channel OtopLc-like isoform X4 [Megalopta genalis]